jgi:ferredoxin
MTVVMPGNAIINPPEIQKERLIKAQTQIKLISQAIIKRRQHVIEGNNSAGTYFKGLLLDIVLNCLIRPAKSFWAQDDCNHCGICARVCSMKNISFDFEYKPTWGNHCTNCLACFNWCPRQAIEINKRPTDKKRYHHPEVTADEISGFRN